MQSIAWFSLFVAGLLEVAWAFFMKKSDGFTILYPSILTFITVLASFYLLSISVKTLPLGTSYAIWSGIGILGTFIIGIMFLGETATLMRSIAALMIVSGLILMKISQ
jgi:quaternary ammonium compound-resistance protein SugE